RSQRGLPGDRRPGTSRRPKAGSRPRLTRDRRASVDIQLQELMHEGHQVRGRNRMELQALSQCLDSIVADRHGRLPRVQEQLDRLDRVEQALRSVDDAAVGLPPDWSNDPSVRDAIERLRDPEVARSLASARALLQSVQARYSRDSINIGVSGRARVGKSLMLQSISGLDDEQVPTGEGTNVTAIRSRIFHASAPRATITFHTR